MNGGVGVEFDRTHMPDSLALWAICKGSDIAYGSFAQMRGANTRTARYRVFLFYCSEDEWNAFYESVLEPIGIQMSLEFSSKLFTPTEKYFGNEVIFESNRLQYASNKTKIELVRYANNIMTINELREVFNLTPIDNGDEILIDQNHSDTLGNMVNEGGNNEEGN